jgi:hypothetical protein
MAKKTAAKAKKTGLSVKAGPVRLMLIEFFPDALRRNERSMLFPFLKGLAQEKGIETTWLCFGARQYDMRPGSEEWTSSVGRGGSTSLELGMRLDLFRPTHIISSDELQGEMKKRLDASRPRAGFVVMPSSTQAYQGGPEDGEPDEVVSCDPNDRRHYARCAWFFDWLGLSEPARDAKYLIEEAVPNYATEFGDEAAHTLKPLISIASGVLCGNRRRLRDNPLFKGILPAASAPGQPEGGHHGCSFCGSDRAPLTSSGANIPALVEKQFRGILETAGAEGRNKGLYEFFDIQAFWKFDEVFDVILRLKVPPAIFLFNPRVDDVLRAKERIAKTLPALEKAGHEVRILSMGIENFSTNESARFNKGITVEHVDGFLALAKEWGSAYPTVFKPFRGGSEKVELGFILFTPWTTLKDIRINLEQAKARNFAEQGYWLYSTLHIRPGDPLFLLAKKNGGILGGGFSDKGQLFGLFKNEGDGAKVVRWRFRDPKVADFFAVIVRICAAEREGNSSVFFAGDPLFALAKKLYAEANASVPTLPLTLALALLDHMEAPRPPRSREKLLREAFRRASAAPRSAGAHAHMGAPASIKPAAPTGPRPANPLMQAAIDEAGRALRDGRDKALAGVTIAAAEANGPVDGSFRLDLLVDGRALSIALLGAGYTGPVFLESGAFKVIYLKTDVEWGGSELGAASARLRLLVSLIERALQAAR